VVGDIDDFCPGSFGGPPTDHKMTSEGLAGTTCPECGNVAEIHLTQPGPDPHCVDGWRIEAHDRSGRTIRLEQQERH
jgi:hypothetical protein